MYVFVCLCVCVLLLCVVVVCWCVCVVLVCVCVVLPCVLCCRVCVCVLPCVLPWCVAVVRCCGVLLWCVVSVRQIKGLVELLSRFQLHRSQVPAQVQLTSHHRSVQGGVREAWVALPKEGTLDGRVLRATPIIGLVLLLLQTPG